MSLQEASSHVDTLTVKGASEEHHPLAASYTLQSDRPRIGEYDIAGGIWPLANRVSPLQPPLLPATSSTTDLGIR